MIHLLGIEYEEKIKKNILSCNYLKKILIDNELQLEKVVINTEILQQEDFTFFELPFYLYLSYKGRLCKYEGLIQEHLFSDSEGEIPENYSFEMNQEKLSTVSFTRDYNSAFVSPLISRVNWLNIDEVVDENNYQFLIGYIENKLDFFLYPLKLERTNFFKKSYEYNKKYLNKNLVQLVILRLQEKLNNLEIIETDITNSFNENLNYELDKFKTNINFEEIKKILYFELDILSKNIENYILK